MESIREDLVDDLIDEAKRDCFIEVWQKWCELNNREFDKWLHSKVNHS